nr:YhgE/Pip domain-containing protein [Lentibacillus saliphilus]
MASLPFSVFSEENKDIDSDGQHAMTGTFSTKDEVVYGNLDASGHINHMYVVNTFHITEQGKIVDYGNYNDIRNLTDLTQIEKKDDETIEFDAQESEFHYQGELENQPLPWNISITYLLDGQKIDPTELAGKSGSIEIQIKTSANDAVDPVFFNNFLQQISVTLDPAKFSNIQAPKGTKANVGKNKQITFSILPEKEDVLKITANVTEFELKPIQINALPANIAIENPDVGSMKNDMETLSDAVRELKSGITQLNDGITDLNTGAHDLATGSGEYASGINALNSRSNDLITGSENIQAALHQMRDMLEGKTDAPDLSELKQLPQGLRDIAGGLNESAAGLDTLKENYNQAYTTLDEAITGIPDYSISEEDIEALYASGADQTVVDQLVATYEAAQRVKQTYQAVQGGFAAVTGTLDRISQPLQDMAGSLTTIADNVDAEIEQLDQLSHLAELQKGLSTLAKKYKSFHSGLVGYTDGVNSLAHSYTELDQGITSLSGGTSSLSDGANDLQAGAQKLQDATDDLPDQMQSEVDEMLEEFDYSDFEPVSFVSDQNEKVEVVQFVLQTESIVLHEQEADVIDEKEEKGLWERFLDLFR